MNLSDDLRRAPWKGSPNPLAGHCYVACEALSHLGGYAAGFRPATVRHEGAVHWFLVDAAGLVVDPTASQFASLPPYSAGVRRGFLTREPSKRARILMSRLTS